MTPQEFLDLICRPNVLAFEGEPTSISKAWSAVVALGQFADCYAKDRGITVLTARADIEKEFRRFGLLTDVSVANKHFEVKRKQSGRMGLSIKHQGIGKGAAYSDGTYHSDGTSFAEHPDVVRIDFGSEHVDLLHLCVSCLAALDSFVRQPRSGTETGE
jgi:hypothetical protein